MHNTLNMHYMHISCSLYIYTHILFYDNTYGRTITTFVEYLLTQFGNAALLYDISTSQLKNAENLLEI